MMDQVCNEIKRVLLAGVGLADKGIQKVGQGVNSLSQHGEEVWQKLTAKQKCASCPQDEIDELLSSLSPEQLDALRRALNAQPPEAPEQPQNDENS